MRLSSWGAILGGILGASCGSSASFSFPDAGVDGGGSSSGSPDAGGVDAGATPGTNGPFKPAVVFVNGLVNGAAAANFTLGDVRICVEGVTQYALPDDQPMPLANYPGVGVGQGIDLGVLPNLPATATIDVFNASDLASDAAWTSQRLDCSVITCSQDAGPTCKNHVTLQVALAQAVNLVVLRDAAQGVELRTTPLDASYTGTPGTIQAQIASFAGWHVADDVVADFGEVQQKTPSITLTPFLGSDVASSTSTLVVPGQSYEDYGVWLTQLVDGAPGDTFAQSLGSIQWVSDPTTAPSTFYDVRENYALVLVGDPSNLLLATNGRDPSFDGRALHVVAVPFAAGVHP